MFIEIIQNHIDYDSLGKILKNELSKKFDSIENVRTSKIYYFRNDFDIKFITELLTDSITDKGIIDNHADIENDYIIDIEYKPGVMDTEAETLTDYLKMTFPDIGEIKTVRRYYIKDKLNKKDEVIKYMKNRLYNPLIETITNDIYFIPDLKKEEKFMVNSISLNCDLIELSKNMTLSLNINEMEEVKSHFDKIGREPTDIELETIAQTWSEHCVHKTFKSSIDYKGKHIDNLFKQTIMKATEVIDHPDAISVFHDNAGIWNLDNNNCICFKVETHNHPSALEPYGGAGTGIGGVIRDVIGTGLGFKPIANTDVFCVGDNNDDIPEGTIRPDDVLKGIVSGVRDYGNRMGIPTVNGAVHFHNDFAGNPLVYAGSMGISKIKNAFKKVNDGDMIVLVGGKTGRDGVHGATFSSVSLHNKSQEVSSGAVQIGNPIEEKKMLDAIIESDGLYSAITDCGAGGLSSAVGEMGEKTGADVILDNVPLKYNGLSYDEIWISESQERMVLSVPERNYSILEKIMKKHSTNISHIGFFTGKKLHIKYREKVVCDLDMDFLFNGIPMQKRTALPYINLEKGNDPDIKTDNYNELIKQVIKDKNVKSKEWIIRQYDYEVMAQTMVKPLGGTNQDNVNDAAVLLPLASDKCIVLGNGINPHYGRINPGKMTLCVIDEAMRNILSQGADINHTAILDNYSWGDVNNNERTLGALVESAINCRDYAIKLNVPFISGKDSLNNYYEMQDKRIEIPHTLLISAMSVTEISNIHPSFFTGKDTSIYLYGKETQNELAGSVLFRQLNMENDGTMPDIDIDESSQILKKLSKMNSMNIILSCHDISDGGMIISLLEMCFGNKRGADISIDSKLKLWQFLFSETQTRFIIEIDNDNEDVFKNIAGRYALKLGTVKEKSEININNELNIDVNEMKKLWKD